MKKLLTLLIASSLLFACSSSSSDWDDDSNNGNGKGTTTQLGKTTTPIPASEWKGYANDPKSPNYIGKDKIYISPIFGDWELVNENGKPATRFLAFGFTLGRGWYSIVKKPANNENPNFINQVLYEYNDTQLREQDNGILYTYKTSADLSTMTLFDGSNTLGFKKYDNNGVWKWNGDWNDKNNPYYAIYNGKYNPVKGEWRVVQVRDIPSPKDTSFFKFEDNCLVYTKNIYYEEDKEYRLHTRYILNNNGLKTTTSQAILGYTTNKYWIKGDTLFLQGVSAFSKLQEISKLVRVK